MSRSMGSLNAVLKRHMVSKGFKRLVNLCEVTIEILDVGYSIFSILRYYIFLNILIVDMT